MSNPTPFPKRVEKNAAAAHNRTIYIANAAFQEMIEHCQAEAPYEACGLLSGTGTYCHTAWKIENEEKSAVSFAMNMDEVKNVVKHLKQQGQQLTGIYHSHPTAAPFPSRDDILNHHYPTVAYFIVSLAFQTPQVNCYYIQRHKAIPLALKILD